MVHFETEIDYHLFVCSRLTGDVHFYGYAEDSWNPNTYPITRFLSETGVQSLPSLDTWRQATNNLSDLNYWSDFINHRQHAGNGQQTIMFVFDSKKKCTLFSYVNSFRSHIMSNLPLPQTNDSLKNFTQLIYLSQIMQAMTMKSISDVCRLHSPADHIDPKTSQG